MLSIGLAETVAETVGELDGGCILFNERGQGAPVKGEVKRIARNRRRRILIADEFKLVIEIDRDRIGQRVK